MNQTGVCGTGSPRTARMKALVRGVLAASLTGTASQAARRVRTSRICGPTYCVGMVVRQETRPGAGADDEPPEFTAAVATMRAARLRPEIHCEEMPAPQRIAPFAAALSADVTVDGDEIGHRPDHPAPRPARQRRVGRRVPLRRLRAGRDRRRADHRPDAGRGRLDLAHRRPRRARRVLPHGVRDGDARGDGELRGDGRGQRRRAAGDPRLVDARRDARHPGRRRGSARTSTSVRTSRLGESCSAQRSGCHRCPTAWPSSRAAGDSAARGPESVSDQPTIRPKSRSRPPGGARAAAAHPSRGSAHHHRHRGRRSPRRARRSPPAPARSRSTPSGPPATATPAAPT